MDLGKYNSLASVDSVYISKAIAVLEGMLGYSLDSELRNENQVTSLTGANRLFLMNKNDEFVKIDPAYSISGVKLFVNFEFEEDLEYNVVERNGLVKYIVPDYSLPCGCRSLCDCNNYQIAVNADWAFSEGKIPDDLLSVIAEMGNYYSDLKKDIKSESLGTHSYTRFDRIKPETDSSNLEIIKRYAGPKGSVSKPVV